MKIKRIICDHGTHIGGKLLGIVCLGDFFDEEYYAEDRHGYSNADKRNSQMAQAILSVCLEK
jgi:hypothetical protein